MQITETAAVELRDYLIDAGQPDGMLRVFVAPGGCSGLQYGMSVETDKEDDDELFEQYGVKLLVDPFSASYLGEAEVDYVNALMGGGFTIHNPQAIASCSCGHSFDTGAGAATASSCGCG